MTGVRFDHYDWAGGREAMLRFGPDTGPVVIAALPLFEEANRMRAFTVSILRALADYGLASALPDVPGQGESLAPLETMSLLQMAEGIEAASEAIAGEGRRTYGLGIRSGCLIDGLALHFGRWHFAPQTGGEVLRELQRQWIAADLPARSKLDVAAMQWSQADTVEIAGNRLGEDMMACLSVYEPYDEPGVPRRVVRLESDPRPADRRIAGVPLWRRAEPGNDPALATLLARDIAEWIAVCEG